MVKRRWLRILLQILVLLLVAGFGAFSTFLFNPFEGGFEYDLASLVPREVDFFAAKDDLEEAFDPFPRPAFLDDMERSPSGRVLLGLSAVRELVAPEGAAADVERLRRELDRLPLAIDVLDVFGGEELVLAGFFEPADVTRSDWAVYGRVSWIGKLGVELLHYPGLIGVESQGLSVEESDDVLALSGGGLPRPLHLTRIRDVLVVATSDSLARRARELEGARGENSFALSAKYGDHVGSYGREGDELELYVDYRRLAQTLSWPSKWPNAYSPDLAPALAGRLFQLGFLGDVLGVVDFGRGITARVWASISSETMSSMQKRLYRERGFDKERALDVARLAPEDTGLFLVMNADVGDLLREAIGALGEDFASNLDDLARAVWGYPDHNRLVDDLDSIFRGRVALVVRDEDYPDEGETGPPHDDQPVPAWAVVLWPSDREKLEEIRSRIVSRQADLGISGREPGTRGVFENTVEGGYKVYEYWSRFVPGTGHVATVHFNISKTADYFVLSNSHQMLGHVVKTYFDGAPRYPRLADLAPFRTFVNAGLSSTNLLAWFAPRAITETTHAVAERLASQPHLMIDWQVERPRIEAEVLRQHFGGRPRSQLSPAEVERLEDLAQVARDAFQESVRGERRVELHDRYRRLLRALETTDGTLVEVGTDERKLDLFLRVVLPLEEDPES